MQTGGRQPASSDYNFLRPASKESSSASAKGSKPLTASDVEFMSRMDSDIDGRRRTAFITELRAPPARTRD